MPEKKKLVSHRDLDVYQMAFAAAMRIFELTKKFPMEIKADTFCFNRES